MDQTQLDDLALKAKWALWQREKNPDQSVALRAMIALDLLEYDLAKRRSAQLAVTEA